MSSSSSKDIRLDAALSFELKLKKVDLTNDELDEIENDLAEKLKTFCDKRGREIDPQNSAWVLHRFGQVYQKRSPDMFSLIRSATLYNAALARHPSNCHTIQHDLQQLCSHILSLAGAKNRHVQLIEEANKIKKAVLKMRKNVAQTLCVKKSIPQNANNDEEEHSLKVEKILLFQRLQNQITTDYKQIMADLAYFCEKVMGEPPCRFALVGMGSIARREITPYSDFENIILLDNEVTLTNKLDENVLQYFRWYSVIFQIVLINLQETIVPSVAISSLSGWFFDAITLRGISFDGMMPHACKFPLGRLQPTPKKLFTTELIKPVNEMLKYLSSEENLKNGYHLSDILSKTCFVYKDKDIFEEFEKGVFEITEKKTNLENILEDVKNQVIEDLQAFATRFSLSKLKPEKKFNVKQVVYRSTTMFISALGRICNIRASSCFDIVTELHVQKHISEYAKHKLLYAVALACEVRLRWYMKVNRQSDSINSVREMIELIGKRSTLCYFQIAYALQSEISKQLNLKQGHFYSSPILLNLTLFIYFKDEKNLIKMLHVQSRATPSQRLYGFDQSLRELEKQISECTKVKEDLLGSSVTESQEFWKRFHTLGQILHSKGCFDDAIECFQISIELIQQLQAGQLDENNELNRYFLINIARCYRKIAWSLNFLIDYRHAEENAKKSLELLLNLSPGNDINRQLALSFKQYGYSLSKLGLHEEAKENLMKSLKIITQLSFNVDYDNDVSEVLNKLGRCFFHMENFEEAIGVLKKAILIQERMSADVDRDRKISVTLLDLGRCLMKIEKFGEAKLCIERSLQIDYARLLGEVFCYRDASVTLYYLGCCCLDLNQLHEANDYLKISQDIAERVSIDVSIDREVSNTLWVLGCCSAKMKKFDNAKIYLKKSLKIKEQMSISDIDRREISSIKLLIEDCSSKAKK